MKTRNDKFTLTYELMWKTDAEKDENKWATREDNYSCVYAPVFTKFGFPLPRTRTFINAQFLPKSAHMFLNKFYL